MRKGQRGKKIGPSSSRAALSPKDRLRQQAYGLRNVRNFAQAKPLLEELYKLEPDNVPLALDLGEAYMETEDFGSATSLYAKLIEKDPKNINAVTNLGGSLIRQGKLNDARSILEYALQLDPKSIHARINLGGVLQASGERKANLDNALEAVQIDPSSSLAFNNLGSAFSDMAMFKEAKHAYETAVMLDPNQVDALINLAAVEARLGDSKASAEMYERVIKKLPKEAEQRIEATKFYAAFEYLKQGNLEKGWDYYEGGFSPLVPAKGARSPRRNFDVPRWDGQPLNGKTLLVWREQGLGDELLFATCLHELEALGGNIIVECDARLVTVFQRSFPQHIIRAETFMPNHGMKSPFSDFDLHLPMGSLMKYFRRQITDFERSGAFIKPDPVRLAKFQKRLEPYKDTHRLVGICWRSGKLDPVRNLNYTTLDEWADTLKAPLHLFVNLQYGYSEDEIRAVESQFGISILRWPDLDLRNDLEDVLGLISCLDGVISVQTAVLVMAGVVGVASLGVKAGGWTNLGQRRLSPWFDHRLNIRNLESCLEHLEWLIFQRHLEHMPLEPFWSKRTGLQHIFAQSGFLAYKSELEAITISPSLASSQALQFRVLRPRTYLDLSQILWRVSSPEASLLCVEYAYAMDSSLTGGYLKLAFLESFNGEWDSARALADRDWNLERVAATDLIEYAVILAHSGTLEFAKELVRRAYELLPQVTDGFARLGYSKLGAKEWSVALDLINIDHKLDRLTFPFYLGKALCHIHLGETEVGVDVIRNAYNGDHKLTDFFTIVAAIPAEKSDWLSALSLAKLDEQENRLSPLYAICLATIWINIGDLKRAISYYDLAIKSGGKDILERARSLEKINPLFDITKIISSIEQVSPIIID